MRWDAAFYQIQLENVDLPMMRMDVLKLAELGQQRLAGPLAESKQFGISPVFNISNRSPQVIVQSKRGQ